MGSKMRFVLVAVFCVLYTGCKKDQDQGREKTQYVLLFSENAKGWFSKVKDESIAFKSTNGLSELYSYTITRTTEYGLNDRIGEEYYLSCQPSLAKIYFSFRVSNVDAAEHIEMEYVNDLDYFSTIQFSFNQWFLLDSPFTQIAYQCSIRDKPISLGLKYIGDTTVNNKNYTDIFRSAIRYKTTVPANAVNEIYISKSMGLVAFKVQDSIIWYRE